MILKDVYKTITPKSKGLYLIWMGIHSILLVWGMAGRSGRVIPSKGFFPFSSYHKYTSSFNITNYDYTEFLLYLFVPVLFYFGFKLIKDSK